MFLRDFKVKFDDETEDYFDSFSLSKNKIVHLYSDKKFKIRILTVSIKGVELIKQISFEIKNKKDHYKLSYIPF